VHLAAITAEGSLEQVVFELLRWAQVRGTLEELIISAISQNSGNQELQRVAVLVGVSSGLSSSDVPPADTLPSIWNIPYPRNPFFTGQEAVLTQLTNALKAGQAAALSQPQAISGLGGIVRHEVVSVIVSCNKGVVAKPAVPPAVSLNGEAGRQQPVRSPLTTPLNWKGGSQTVRGGCCLLASKRIGG